MPSEREQVELDRVAEDGQRNRSDSLSMAAVKVDHSSGVSRLTESADDCGEQFDIALDHSRIGRRPGEDLCPVLRQPAAEKVGPLTDHVPESTERLEDGDGSILITPCREGDRIDEPGSPGPAVGGVEQSGKIGEPLRRAVPLADHLAGTGI